MSTSRYEFPDWIYRLSIEDSVKLLLLGFFGGTAPSGTSPGLPIGGGVQESLTSVVATGNGSIAAGAKSVCFQTSSDFAGTVNGVTRAVSQVICLTVGNPPDTLLAIPYTISAGTLTIDRLA